VGKLRTSVAIVAWLAASSTLAQNAKVSTLIPATTPLTGTELFYVVQGGVSKNMTFSALQSALSGSAFSSLTIGAGAAITSSGSGGVLGNPAFVASSVTKTCGATIVVTNGVVTSC
jgi:hypothetical protein